MAAGHSTRPEPKTTADRSNRIHRANLTTAVATRLSDIETETGLLYLASMRLGRIVERDLNDVLRADGLERSEHSVLTSLWFNPRWNTPSQLSATIVQTTSGMTKTVRRLERKGLVARFASPDDGRSQTIRLTRRGHSLAEKHIRQLVALWKERLDSYDSQQRSRLAETLWSFVMLLDPSIEPDDIR
jgi:DNA-binding MarR family transcriptional regulator